MNKISFISVIAICLVVGLAMEVDLLDPVIGVLACIALGASAMVVHLTSGANS